ncbi:MAG: PGPGW domain-containing protein [Planctomycetaceae bacterium]|nr:PGPGW domain-containing protein [Planctomycetaceae bacterium]
MDQQQKTALRSQRLRVRWKLFFWRQARKIVIAVIGGTVILAGVAMLALPGPGWVTIFGGLAILATEFAWARWVLKVAKERLAKVMEQVNLSMAKPPDALPKVAPPPQQACSSHPETTS